jgi:D-alanyl-D-alanine carboxypeptidase
MNRRPLGLLLLVVALAACSRTPAESLRLTTSIAVQPTPAPAVAITATTAATNAAPAMATAVLATATPPVTATTVPDVPSPTLPPVTTGEPRCGLSLPVLAPPPNPETTSLQLSSFLALERVPEAARPAVEYMLREPGSVGLAAYELGQEGEGVYLNPDLPLPLASVVKLIHLITYAEAVQNGELDPAQPVTLDELESFYLANSDLSAHPNAVAALRAEGRVFGDPPSVLLADVPRMMMQYSSNAATDYLHLLLGQERLEATIASLGMTEHTAPCPFLGQFLLMSEGEAAVADYLDDPEHYATEVMAATLAFSSEDAATPRGWRGPSRRPEVSTQEVYSELFNAHGSARDYAALMGKIADNQFGPWEQNVRIRSYLEWPTAFPANQPALAWLGYKGGSLPGLLTVTYYAQPWDRARPVVVALFFHDLPTSTFRQWRRQLPHDELARWLLYDRDAIAILQTILSGGELPG